MAEQRKSRYQSRNLPRFGNKKYDTKIYEQGGPDLSSFTRQQGRDFAAITSQAAANTQKAFDNLEAQKTARQEKSQAYMDWTMAFQIQNTDAVTQLVSKSGANNPQLAEAAMWQLDGLNMAGEAAKRAETPEEQRIALKQLQGFKTRISSLGVNIDRQNISIKQFAEDAQARLLNTQGGLNLNSPKGLVYGKQMAITVGMNPGEMTWLVDEDGDWAVRHDGPLMDEPTITKASTFFEEEPGIIPESNKAIQKIMQDSLGLIDDKGRVIDDFVLGNKSKLVSIGQGMMQEQTVTNEALIAQRMQPYLKSYALSYASNYDTAEAYWDSLPENIRTDVRNLMKEQGLEDPGDDLTPGLITVGSSSLQVNKNSWFAMENALYAQAKAMVPKVRKGRIMQDKNYIKSGSSSNGLGGQNDMFSMLKNIVDLPPQQQLDMLKLNANDSQSFKYNPPSTNDLKINPQAKGVITIETKRDANIDPPNQEKMIGFENSVGFIKGGSPGDEGYDEQIANANIMEVFNLSERDSKGETGGLNAWYNRIADLYLGNTAADRKVRARFQAFLTDGRGQGNSSAPAVERGFLNVN